VGAEERADFQGTERFGILRRIGAGGMGVVYEAYDRERESLVALKTLREASPETIFLFKQEFRSLARTAHPNLVPLYEFISDGEQWFFTMELLQDAVDLRTFLRSTEAPVASDRHAPGPDPAQESSINEDETIDAPMEDPSWPGAHAGSGGSAGADPVRMSSSRTLDRARIAEVFTQLARGVIALHEARILHRDLKPANVMVRKDGQVVLLDFGLVQELGVDDRSPGVRSGSSSSDAKRKESSHTSGRITGSVLYMAPEQAAAQALSPASDWYAVGVMLYEVLTGRLPIDGRSIDVLRNKQLFDPPAPQELVPGIPDDLGSLCMDLLSRDPERRPTGPEVVARLGGEGAPSECRDGESAASAAIPFIGRKTHLEALARCFERTREGHVGVCRVHGLSGAGKSALIQHFLEDLAVRAEPVVLVGRCYEQESMPYKAVDSLVDALARYLLGLRPEEMARLMPDHMVALARIFPALRRIEQVAVMSAAHEGTSNLEELRLQAFGAFRELLTRIGDNHPLVLFIDDLQWGDLDSAALLREILVADAPPRLLMLFSYRTEYVGVSPCLRALESLAGDGARLIEETVVVDALTNDETRDLALNLLGAGSNDAAARADWVVEESGGSALFIYELVQHLQAGMDFFETGEMHLDEILWNRIQRLPEQPRRLLEVVAVASRPIPLRHVQEVAAFRTLPPEIVGSLRSQRLVRTTGPGLEDEIECYHDRIRESIVARLPSAVVAGHHAALAAALERDGSGQPELLAVHLEGAGEHAKAGDYYLLAADQAVAALAFDRADEFFRKALAFADGTSNKAEILERLVHFYTDLARFDDAYRAGREGAALFGIRLPAKFHPPSFIVDLIGARLRFGRREVAGILDLPTMADDRLAGAVRLIAAVAKAAFQLRPELCVAVNARMVNLCLKHGNTADSAIGYMVFGCIFLGGILGNYRRGYEFGRLSLNLVKKYENLRQEAEVHFVVGYFGTSWLQPATEAEALWRTAYSSGLKTGDLFHTGCASCATTLSYFMRGVSMERILEASEEYLELLDRVGLAEPAGAVTAVRQAVRNLQGSTRSRSDFSDSEFDETAFVDSLPGYGSRHMAHYYFVVKLQTLYLWGNLDAALDILQAARPYLKDSAGMLHSAEHHFYEALILAASLRSSTPTQRRSRLRAIRKQHRHLQKWAALCPHNFLHKERLVAGELARHSGDPVRAAGLFLEAQRAAVDGGYLHIEALAHQLTASALRDHDPTASDHHLEAACGLYRRWGAAAYADALGHGIFANENQSEN
jgi:serine/threonine protein kinase/predicted ATPase